MVELGEGERNRAATGNERGLEPWETDHTVHLARRRQRMWESWPLVDETKSEADQANGRYRGICTFWDKQPLILGGTGAGSSKTAGGGLGMVRMAPAVAHPEQPREPLGPVDKSDAAEATRNRWRGWYAADAIQQRLAPAVPARRDMYGYESAPWQDDDERVGVDSAIYKALVAEREATANVAQKIIDLADAADALIRNYNQKLPEGSDQRIVESVKPEPVELQQAVRHDCDCPEARAAARKAAGEAHQGANLG